MNRRRLPRSAPAVGAIPPFPNNLIPAPSHPLYASPIRAPKRDHDEWLVSWRSVRKSRNTFPLRRADQRECGGRAGRESSRPGRFVIRHEVTRTLGHIATLAAAVRLPKAGLPPAAAGPCRERCGETMRQPRIRNEPAPKTPTATARRLPLSHLRTTAGRKPRRCRFWCRKSGRPRAVRGCRMPIWALRKKGRQGAPAMHA